MEILFDILEAVIILAWIGFAMFGSKLFKRKNKQQKPEYPQSPQQEEQVPRTAEEISEEERKLKEWLEGVFGGEQRQPEPVQVEEYEEEEAETQPVYTQPAPSYATVYSKPGTSVDLGYVAPQVQTPVEPERKSSNWRGRIGKSQMAYGLVMAEIFQKPRAMRPFEARPPRQKKSL